MNCPAKKLVIVTALLALLSTATTGFTTEEDSSREYRIKAAYLYNLIKFVDWPAPFNLENRLNTRICVYGENPFGNQLEQLRTRTAKGLPIEVSYLDANQHAELSACQIVFLPATNRDNAVKIAELHARNTAILTVGEDEEFVFDHGGIVSLVLEKNKVQLLVNHQLSKAANFNMSGNLLEIARIITPRKP